MSHDKFNKSNNQARAGVDEQERAVAEQAMKYAAERFEVREGTITFELFRGKANALRIDGQRAYYYAGRDGASPCARSCGESLVNEVLDYVAERLEPIVLERCGEYGKLRAELEPGAIYLELAIPFGPRGRRRARRSAKALESY